jgi:ATP-dependent exoDNAse (exonuclease V) beta subunit
VLAPPARGRTSSKLTEFLKKDEEMVHAEEGIRAHEEWQKKRREVREAAANPQWSVVTATSPQRDGFSETLLAEAGADLVSEVTVERIAPDFSRPHGKRFGTLVHSVLSAVALDASHEGISKVASVQARILGASDEDVEAAIDTVSAVLRHPIVERGAVALAAGLCRRESPVTLKLRDNVMVEGIVDLAYQDENDQWIVVDYKTDFEVKGRIDEYTRQVWLYALAVSRATQKKSRPVLLRV